MKRFTISAGILCITIFLLIAHQVNAQIDVFVYTETTQWINQEAAQKEADILIDMIKGENGIGKVVNDPANKIADWTEAHTKKRGHHIIVLFGDIPPEI